MSVNARRILNAIRDADHTLNDPGAGGRIEIAGDLQICELSTTSAESRTLDDPTKAGIRLTIRMKTDGGDCTVTAANGFNVDGDTQAVFANVGDQLELISVSHTTGFRWEILVNTGPTAMAGGGGVANPLDSIDDVLSWVADPAYITLSGSDVTAWTEKYNGSANFSFASARPVWSTTAGPTGGFAVTKPAGRNLVFGSAPIASSPYSIYAVIRTPTIISGGSTRIIFLGDSKGWLYVNDTDSYMYTNEPPYYSDTQYDAQRTQWMLVCMRVADYNTLHIEINDEPVPFQIKNLAGATTTSIVDFGTNYNGLEIAEWHMAPSILSDADNLAVKQYLVSKYGLTPPAKKVMLFGDSHAHGTQSGSPTGAPFFRNLQADEPGISITRNMANGTTAVNDNTNGDFKDLAPTYAQSKWSSYKIICCYGTNDCATASGGYGWTSWAAWKAQYKSDLQRFITAGWNPADICIMTPPLTTGPYVAGNLTTVKDIIKEIATELSLTLVDWWQLCTDASHDINALGGDGIHGNNVTHALVRSALAAFI